MSTSYKFHCEKCGESGGYLSRQAWGWGCFDIITSFKFLAVHIRECGPEGIKVVSEHDDRYSCAQKNLAERSAGDMPRSNDWAIVRINSQWKNVEQAWKEEYEDSEEEDE